MALVKSPQHGSKPVTKSATRPLTTSQDVERQRRYARTLAKQQQAAERVAAATGQLASGINEAAAAAEELKRASEQIAAGAEQASSAAQKSMSAFHQVTEAIARQLESVEQSQARTEAAQSLIQKTNEDISQLVSNVGVAARGRVARAVPQPPAAPARLAAVVVFCQCRCCFC